jgi:hypothetical protein
LGYVHNNYTCSILALLGVSWDTACILHANSGNEPILREATSISVVVVIFGALVVIG